MRILAGFFLLVLIAGCNASKPSYSPYKKYSPAQLQKDYNIYKEILEEDHPGLYWYTSRDSMQHYFDWGRERLNDSLTEPDFRKVLVYVTAKINCGHTSVRSSKAYSRYIDTARVIRMFPFGMRLWKDTAVIVTNLNRRDSILKRGTMITKINHRPMTEIVDTFFQYIGSDGYNTTHKYQTLSNRGYFGSLYSSLYGLSPQYEVEYLDSAGQQQHTIVNPYYPAADTFSRSTIIPPGSFPRPTRKERKNMQKNAVRFLKIDSANHVAMMDLNGFSRGYGLKKFFHKSFKTLRKQKINYLIVDVRANGGGSPTNSTLITRYLANEPFKIADSLYAISKRKKYGHCIEGDFFNRMFMTFFTKKKADGYYHLGYFERHYFKPKKKNHFEGKTYILTGGASFSATTLFAGALVKQDNITVVGEETGGGAYGNTAWQIPTVTLPETGIRFNLPLYRLVIDKNYPKTGHGVQPEIEVRPNIESVKSRTDRVLQVTLELIRQDKGLSAY